MAKDIREHLRVHVTYGHTPTPFMLLSANAALCSDCKSIVVLTKKGLMRKHGQCGPSASPLKSSGSIGPHSQKAPPSKRKRLAGNGLEAGKADDSQSQQRAGDAGKDEDETNHDDEAGGQAAALNEETEDDQNKPQDEAGTSDAEGMKPDDADAKPRFQKSRDAFAYVAGLLHVGMNALQSAVGDSSLAKFFETPLSAVWQPKKRNADGSHVMHGPNPVPVQAAGAPAMQRKVNRALNFLGEGHLGRAIKALEPTGFADLGSAAMQAVLLSKHLKEPPGTAQAQCPPVQRDLIPTISVACIEEIIESRSAFTAPGHTGWSYRHYKMIFKDSKRHSAPEQVRAFPANLTTLVNRLARDDISDDLRHYVVNTRNVALAKGARDMRPIGIVNVATNVMQMGLMKDEAVTSAFDSLISKRDFAHGVRGGAEAVAHMVRAKMSEDPDAVLLVMDFKHAFGSIHTQTILDKGHAIPELSGAISLLFGHPGKKAIYESTNGGKIELLSERGFDQGGALSMPLFCTCTSEALKAFEANMPDSLLHVRFADDMTNGDRAKSVFAALKEILPALKAIGLDVQPPKCGLYIPATVSQPEVEIAKKLAAEHGIPVVEGVTICGCPFGPPAYCERVAKRVVDDALLRLERIASIVEGDEDPESNSMQQACVLTRFCVVPCVAMHLVRTTPRVLCGGELKCFDEGAKEAVIRFLRIKGLSAERRKVFNKRFELDLVCGGFGLPSLADLADRAFLGSTALTVSCCPRVFNRDMALCFPEMTRLIEAGMLSGLPDFAEKKVRDFIEAPALKIQAALTHAGRSERLKEVVALLPDKQDRSNLLSGASAEAAAWLTVVPLWRDKTLVLKNGEFSAKWSSGSGWMSRA